MYASLQGSIKIVTLSFADANRANMFKMLNRANQSSRHCHAVVVSSHGKPGVVLDDSDSPDEILFSNNDTSDELALIGNNRSVYICACETGDSNLPELLVQNGCNIAIAYRLRPSWKNAETAMMWRDFDRDIVKALIYRQGADAVRITRDHYIKMIDDNIGYYDDYYAKDFKRMKETLQTICIEQ